MATVKHALVSSDGWVEVVADGADFLAENQSSNPIQVTFAASAPAAGAPFHNLGPGEALIRVADGAVYARGINTSPAQALVVSS